MKAVLTIPSDEITRVLEEYVKSTYLSRYGNDITFICHNFNGDGDYEFEFEVTQKEG